MRLVIIIIYSALLLIAWHIPKEDAKEVVRKAEEKVRGNTSRAELTIQTIRPTWTRDLKLKTWSKGDDYAMILITSPAKEKGTVFLKNDKEVWNWVPSIERVIKLPPSMMSQSWMGTDFTNDDLVRESSTVEDYTHSFGADSTIDGKECYKIRLIPKPEVAVVWEMIDMWVDKKDYLQLRAEFFDENHELVNTMYASEVKNLGGRLLPSKVELTPVGKKGEKTVMLYNSISFNEPIEEGFFTTQNMKKIK